jgi:hypothetical protein
MPTPAKFAAHVKDFLKIMKNIDSHQLHKLGGKEIDLALEWGLYFEKVLQGLSVEKQQEMLQDCDQGVVEDLGGRLMQGRRWVLSSALFNPFLLTHPNRSEMLAIIHTAYDDIDKDGAGYFAEDVGSIISIRAQALVHLEQVTMLQHVIQRKSAAAGGGIYSRQQPAASSMKENDHISHAKALLEFDLTPRSVECRAAARLLVGKMLQSKGMYAKTVLKSLRSRARRRKDAPSPNTTFMELEILVHMMREAVAESRTNSSGYWTQWEVSGSSKDLEARLCSSPISDLVNLTLSFSMDARLWQLHPALLAEVGHFYFPFAQAYCRFILKKLANYLDAEVTEGMSPELVRHDRWGI